MEGASVTHSNIVEAENKKALSMFDVSLHILSQGDCFSITQRRPVSGGSLEKSIILEKQATNIKISKRKKNKAELKK